MQGKMLQAGDARSSWCCTKAKPLLPLSHSSQLLFFLLSCRSWSQLVKLGALNKPGIWSSEWDLFICCSSWGGTTITWNHSSRRALSLSLWRRQPLQRPPVGLLIHTRSLSQSKADSLLVLHTENSVFNKRTSHTSWFCLHWFQALGKQLLSQ